MSLDPILVELRRGLRRFRRRLWLRRVVRDAVRIAAMVIVELALAGVARLMPFEWHGLSGRRADRRGHPGRC
jgi:hypothetical protein